MPEYSPSVFSRRKGIVAGGDGRVLRLDAEEVVVVRRSGAVADALTRHERRPAVLQQVDRGRADATARRRAAEHDRVDPLSEQDRREVRAEEARGTLLQHYRLVVPRLEPRVDVDPVPTDLQCPE